MYQVLDKITVGIPDDMELLRQKCEDLRDDAEGFAIEAHGSMEKALEYEQRAGEHADDAYRHSLASERSAELAQDALDEAAKREQNVEAVPFEPRRYHGKIWLKTDEKTKHITNIYRWDEYAIGSGVYPSDSIWPSDTLYPETVDSEDYGDGKWTELWFESSVMA